MQGKTIPAGVALVAITLLLMLPIFVLMQIAWPNWFEEFAGGQRGFSQNLLSESIGVAVATAIIVPLANWTGELLQRGRRKKVARQFLSLVCTQFEEVRVEYLSLFAQDIGPAKFMLESAAAGQSFDRLQETIDRMNRTTARITKIGDALRGKGEAEPTGAGQEDESAAARNRSDAEYASRVAAHLQAILASLERIDDLVEDLQALDRVSALYATVIEPEMIAQVASFTGEIRSQLTRFRALRRYLSGNATHKDRAAVSGARFFTGRLAGMLHEILASADANDLTKTLTAPDVDLAQQQKIFETIARFVDEQYYKDDSPKQT